MSWNKLEIDQVEVFKKVGSESIKIEITFTDDLGVSKQVVLTESVLK